MNKQNIYKIIFIVITLILVVLISLLFAIKFDYDYEIFIRFTNIPDLFGGTHEQIIDDYKNIMDFIRLDRYYLNIQDFNYSDEGLIHIYDVRFLVSLLYIVTFVIILIYIIFRIIVHKKELIDRKDLAETFKKVSWIFMSLSILLILITLILDDKITLLLNKLIFSNNYYDIHGYIDTWKFIIPERFIKIKHILFLIYCIILTFITRIILNMALKEKIDKPKKTNKDK